MIVIPIAYHGFLQHQDCCVHVLVTSFKETILAECSGMIRSNETESAFDRLRQPRSRVCTTFTWCCVAELRLMFSLMDRVAEGILPMKDDLEKHIKSQGLADMTAAAATITTVRLTSLRLLCHIAARLLFAGLGAVRGETSRTLQPIQSSREGGLQRRPALPDVTRYRETRPLAITSLSADTSCDCV